MTQAQDTTATDQAWLEASGSRNLSAWMAQYRLSLAFTTYQAGKLFFIGCRPDRQLSVFERTFARCMGLWSDGQTLWMSSKFQLWRFENVLQPGVTHEGYDKLYVPRVGYTTGDLDIHDICVNRTGGVVFVNTLFGCLATLCERDSFRPLWRPPFLSKLAAEDRCHLNGLAMVDGEPAYVTAVSTTDAVDGWRERRRDGGVVIDIKSGKTVATGLSMPHSPRHYRGKLWLHNSGAGYLGSIDPLRGVFEPLAFCPGYLRGLAFIDHFAVVGLSKPRHDRTFGGLALDEELAKRGVEPWCGIQVIDLNTGDCVHWLRLDGLVAELYDVVVLPKVSRPMALGFKTDEIQRMLSVDAREQNPAAS